MPFDDTVEYAHGMQPSTTWIENEIRRINADREHWQARWYLLKLWLADHQNISDSKTLHTIHAYMEELEQKSPNLPPYKPAITVVEESSESTSQVE